MSLHAPLTLEMIDQTIPAAIAQIEESILDVIRGPSEVLEREISVSVEKRHPHSTAMENHAQGMHMAAIAPDNTLYFGWVQTSPFARPQIDDIAGAIRFRLDKNYPPRGMYLGPLPEDR